MFTNQKLLSANICKVNKLLSAKSCKVKNISQVYTIQDYQGNDIFLILKHLWGKIDSINRSMKIDDYLLNTFLKKKPHIYSICGFFFENDRILNYNIIEGGLDIEVKENFNIVKAKSGLKTAKFPGFISDKHKIIKACELLYKEAPSYVKLDYMRRVKEYKSDIYEHNRLPLYFKEIDL